MVLSLYRVYTIYIYTYITLYIHVRTSIILNICVKKIVKILNTTYSKNIKSYTFIFLFHCMNHTYYMLFFENVRFQTFLYYTSTHVYIHVFNNILYMKIKIRGMMFIYTRWNKINDLRENMKEVKIIKVKWILNDLL